MADKQLSYDYQNSVRDLGNVFKQMFASLPLLISLIAMGEAATATTHEWLEDEIKPVSGVLSGAANSTSTSLSLSSTAGFQKGMILRMETPAGASIDEQVIVTAVASSTRLTVTRGYGSTTAVNLANKTLVFPIAKPLAEATEADADTGREPSVEINYTQIIDRVAKVSKTAQVVKMYGIEDALNYQVSVMMGFISRDLNSQIVYGRKAKRGAASNGSFGGVLQYMDKGIVDTTGGAISSTIINNVFQDIFEAGGMSNRYAICVAPNQARKISAFMTQDKVPANTKLATEGFAVNRFVGDIPAFSGNPYEAFVAVDPNLPKDRMLVLDLNRVALVPLRTFTDENAAPEGADYFARRILGEYTLEIKNGQTAHGKATGLTV